VTTCPKGDLYGTAAWLAGTGGPSYLVKGVEISMMTPAFLILSHKKTWHLRLVSMLLCMPLLLAGCSMVTPIHEPPTPPLIKAVSKGDTPTGAGFARQRGGPCRHGTPTAVPP